MGNLSDLPYDLLVALSKRLKKLEDFVSLRCVSKSLYAAAKDEYFEGLCLRQQLPYLLLSVKEDAIDEDVRELYSLVEDETIVASVKVPKFKNKKCLESLGWLLASEADGSMSLVDPISGQEILLPNQHSIPEYSRLSMRPHAFMHKVVLSSRPDENSDFIVMVVLGVLGSLGFWRPGDKTWNIIKERKGRYLDVIHIGSLKFYAIGFPGVLWAINLDGNNKHPEARVILDCKPIVPSFYELDDNYPSRNIYLLKAIDGTLLIISRKAPVLREDRSSYITSKFHVYEVDIAMGTWKEIYSLGTMAVFVGHNSTFALDASKVPGGIIKPNHIYFTDDDFEHYLLHSESKGGGKNMGIYNMGTGSVELFYHGEPPITKVSPSLWITPNNTFGK